MQIQPDRTPRIVSRAGRMAWAALLIAANGSAAAEPGRPVDFNRHVRPILASRCFRCHGPDPATRVGVAQPLRLDTEAGALADLGGYAAIVRGEPDESELIHRIGSDDRAEVMPPPKMGKKLEPAEIATLRAWVEQGAPYAKHWAYAKPVRPALPEVHESGWAKNPVDRFVLAKLEAEGLKPTPEADRHALIRRVSLDLTGLPPTWEDAERFARDPAPDAYEKLVDRLLASPGAGEYWAQLWLDLARYADSSGYADDPSRTIWAYRDYVVRAFQANMPFDQFTIEQIAGDLLPNPTESQLIATAFHRNTPTNNEGGTIDEEFRTVAVVDRVNTTASVWLGSTLACAQCHDHKYDPFAQAEYFKLSAFFNNTQDADRSDEAPTLPLLGESQKARIVALNGEAGELEATLRTLTPETTSGKGRWEASMAGPPAWRVPRPESAKADGKATLTVLEDNSVRASVGDVADTYHVRLPLDGLALAAIRLEALPDDSLPNRGPGRAEGNFVVTAIRAAIEPPGAARSVGRYFRVELTGKSKILSLAEVQVFDGPENVAVGREAKQSSVAFGGTAGLAVDGNTDGRYEEAKSTTHTDGVDEPWWEVDLGDDRPVDRVAVWNRAGALLEGRLADFKVTLLDANRAPVWTRTVAAPPKPSVSLAVNLDRPLTFVAASADYSQGGFDGSKFLEPKRKGWAVGGQVGRTHALTLALGTPIEAAAGSTLVVAIEQRSPHPNHTLGQFRIAATADPRAAEFVRTPQAVLDALAVPEAERTEPQRATISSHYLAAVAPELAPARARLAEVRRDLAAIKPETTVPIMRERPASDRRVTRIQRRGNFRDPGDAVSEGVPAALHPLPGDAPQDRLGLARWLVAEDNPITPRVVANRYWEHLFGIGLVATGDDFGVQGDLPSHPELLDWLATELVQEGWDLRHLLRLMATSAAYRQDARVSADLARRDPDNRLLARGPRVRLSAETIRDQALAVAGLLSPKMYGPPVKPPQPSSGLSAAFGGKIDWETSRGEDRHRRALYTTWRRSSPYPSMATFDAPSREVCTVRRSRTNTPLQALVTLNDPVYIEAAQALARRTVAAASTPSDRARFAFRVGLIRDPTDVELGRLLQLHKAARSTFSADAARARAMATDPIGPLAEGADPIDLAAWTVVGNVILNLDEMLMKR